MTGRAMNDGTDLNDPVVDELIALEAERRRCLIERDFDGLGRLFADDLTYVHSIGNVQDRATYLAYVQGPLRFLSIERPALQVKRHGDVAIMSGPMVNTIMPPNLEQAVKVGAFVVQAWVRGADAGWRMTHFQATRPPEAPPSRPA
jgi:hypothetical protein